MDNKNISVTEALERLKKGEEIRDLNIDFTGATVKALDAFKLGKAGIDVPEEAIVYDDADVVYDPEFDDYTWERTSLDPLKNLTETAIDEKIARIHALLMQIQLLNEKIESPRAKSGDDSLVDQYLDLKDRFLRDLEAQLQEFDIVAVLKDKNR